MPNSTKLIIKPTERATRAGYSTVLHPYDEPVKEEYSNGTERYENGFKDYHGG